MSAGREDFGIAIRSALLKKSARQKFSLFFLISISFILLLLESLSLKFMSQTRGLINDGIYRVSTVATAPVNIFSETGKILKSHFFVHKENKILKEELEQFKLEKLQTEFLKTQNKALLEIFNMEISIDETKILARVLLDKESPYLKSLVINHGSKDGIAKGMPVLGEKYLVGKIVESNYFSSRILLLNDLNSRIPVMIEDSGVQAIITGKGSYEPILEYLPDTYEPEEGQIVFTSGKDGIFKSGIPIGKTVVEHDSIKVKLFADPNQLDFVSVYLSNISKETKEENEIN